MNCNFSKTYKMQKNRVDFCYWFHGNSSADLKKVLRFIEKYLLLPYSVSVNLLQLAKILQTTENEWERVQQNFAGC